MIQRNHCIQPHKEAVTMSNNSQFKQAQKLYGSCKYGESLNLYEQLFDENPKDFNMRDLISYCWAIYQCRVKNFTDENQLFNATELITELIPQADLL